MSDERFNVVIYYGPKGDRYEFIRENVSAEEAMRTAIEWTKRPGALIGAIYQVQITDSLDLTNFLWRHGEGVVFPKKEDLEARP
jgi:hypothetical protein